MSNVRKSRTRPGCDPTTLPELRGMLAKTPAVSTTCALFGVSLNLAEKEIATFHTIFNWQQQLRMYYYDHNDLLS